MGRVQDERTGLFIPDGGILLENKAPETISSELSRAKSCEVWAPRISLTLGSGGDLEIQWPGVAGRPPRTGICSTICFVSSFDHRASGGNGCLVVNLWGGVRNYSRPVASTQRPSPSRSSPTPLRVHSTVRIELAVHSHNFEGWNDYATRFLGIKQGFSTPLLSLSSWPNLTARHLALLFSGGKKKNLQKPKYLLCTVRDTRFIARARAFSGWM